MASVAGDVAAFGANVASSVLIVFANKVLMKAPVGFAFGKCRPSLKHHALWYPDTSHEPPRTCFNPTDAFVWVVLRFAATCLCALHYLVSGVVARAIEGWKVQDKGSTQKPENVPQRGEAADDYDGSTVSRKLRPSTSHAAYNKRAHGGACLCLAVYVGFSLVASASIASLNISLLVNTVGFYQVCFGGSNSCARRPGWCTRAGD